MDMQKLLKSRTTDFSALTKAISKTTESGYDNDDAEYFQLTRDKAGNGSAVIRFLNAGDGDELPWVTLYRKGFKGPTGKWYVENCLTTLGQEDPVQVAIAPLWQFPKDSPERKLAGERKRKLSYICNIYVVSDPGNRENEGKVFKYKFGLKIWEKIMAKVQPTFEDETPVNVFDYWEGANFKLRIRQVDGYGNYDQSAFGEVGPLAPTDEEILEIVKKQYKLSDLVSPDKFKSYEELEKKYLAVVSPGPVRNDEPVKEPAAPKTVAAKTPKVKEAEPTVEDGEDIEDYFSNLTK
jgi:hypothetical protein